ncbi:MAG: SidE phosphodiesterase domain-containing protein [Coxiellaceae bacterium]|nr:SidE phosphodiesterase domain-containing protein [Coxiellaceae bacterium]
MSREERSAPAGAGAGAGAGGDDSFTVISQPLRQGPSEKNIALKHVEYIFHCMLATEYIGDSKSRLEFEDRMDAAGVPYVFRFEKNAAEQVMAHCPNGRRYNLSLALQHANLNYFQLDDSEAAIALIKRCEEVMGRGVAQAAIADKMRSDIGRKLPQHSRDVETKVMPIYAAEEQAIIQYTKEADVDFGYKKVNALLRGMSCTYGVDEIKQIFIRAMLVISGVNKNKRLSNCGERNKLTRHEGDLPLDILARMQTADQLVTRTGLLSFSKRSVFEHHKNRLVLENARQHQACIDNIAKYKVEREVLFPPSLFQVTSYDAEPGGKHVFHARIVSGVAEEYAQEYLLKVALQQAAVILQQPYKEREDKRFGIARHNHALAHHVRACVLVEPVIEYFKQHAESEEFKKFCDQITAFDLKIMQVMMIFSKTGRESEIGPNDDIDIYMRYQHASARHLADFMRDEMGCDEHTIAYYAEIMINMGNPAYPSILAEEIGEAKHHKLYINHITAFAHKLDLPRVYTKVEYQNSMRGYDGSELSGSTVGYVCPSDHQAESLEKLEYIAMSMIKATGDHLTFGSHGFMSFDYDKELFLQCNAEIDTCWHVCQQGYMSAIKEYSESRLVLRMFMQAVDKYRIDQVSNYLLRFKSKEINDFIELYSMSPLEAVIRSKHAYSSVIHSYCRRTNAVPSIVWRNAFYAAANEQKSDVMMMLVNRIEGESVFHALRHSLHSGFNKAVFNSLLAKIPDSNKGYYCDALLTIAISMGANIDTLQVLFDYGAKLSVDNIKAAFCKCMHADKMEFLLENMPDELNTADVRLEVLVDERPDFIAKLYMCRFGEFDVASVIEQHLSMEQIGPRSFELVIKALHQHPLQQEAILDLMLVYPAILTYHEEEFKSLIYSAICHAIEMSLVEKLLDMGALCNVSILTRALDRGVDDSCVSLLLKHVDYRQISPILAIKIICSFDVFGQLGMLESLIAGGARLTDDSYPSFLEYALDELSVDCIQLLVNLGAKVKYRNLVDALAIEDVDDVMRILLAAVDVEEFTPGFVCDFCANHEKNESLYNLDTILDLGYDINARSLMGYSLLSLSIESKVPFGQVAKLISRGAKVTARDCYLIAEIYAKENDGILDMLVDAFTVDEISPEIIVCLLKAAKTSSKMQLLDKIHDKVGDLNAIDEGRPIPILYCALNKEFSEGEFRLLLDKGLKVSGHDLFTALYNREGWSVKASVLQLLINKVCVETISSEVLVHLIDWLPVQLSSATCDASMRDVARLLEEVDPSLFMVPSAFGGPTPLVSVLQRADLGDLAMLMVNRFPINELSGADFSAIAQGATFQPAVNMLAFRMIEFRFEQMIDSNCILVLWLKRVESVLPGGFDPSIKRFLSDQLVVCGDKVEAELRMYIESHAETTPEAESISVFSPMG